MIKPLTCRHCGREFRPMPGKPGYIDECPNCVKGEIELLGANMIWDHKTAPEIEIKSLKAAKAFAAKTRRHGAGVTCSLVASQGSKEQAIVEGKRNSGAEPRAQYYSRLGEKRSVKP